MINRTENDIFKNWKDEFSEPIVSVCVITYNHEKFISQAIDSFLMQETDFSFEIVIGEDCSTDGTREVVEKYIEIYPNIIKLIASKDNVGMQENFKRTIEACKGEYIAFCEGDDYWTDIKKLQQQKLFLQNNQDYSAIAHQVDIMLNNEFKKFNSHRLGTLDLNDLLFERKFHTASIMFRRWVIQKHPLPTNILSGDKALIVLLGLFGKIYFLENVMGVYRKHDGGISSWVSDELMKKDLNIMPWILDIHPLFPKYRMLSYIHKSIVLHSTKISILNILRHSYLFVFYSFSYFPLNIVHVGKFTLKAFPLKIVKTLKAGLAAKAGEKY